MREEKYSGKPKSWVFFLLLLNGEVRPSQITLLTGTLRLISQPSRTHTAPEMNITIWSPCVSRLRCREGS